MASHFSFSQDLMIDEILMSNSFGITLQHGSEFSFDFKIKNGGNMISDYSKIRFSLANNLNSSNLIDIGEVSVKQMVENSSTNFEKFFYTIPSNFVVGTYYLYVKVDPLNVVVESNENNNFNVFITPITILNNHVQNTTLPYPIIFIHGLNSSFSVWNQFSDYLSKTQGMQYGGTFHFCLNQDSDLSTGSLNDVSNHTNTMFISKADFYYVNFDVNPNGVFGGNNVQSNQSAIVKQGAALSQAIDHVLQITGAEKVILVGHSMGGLCAREYVQRYDLGATNVAKLVTFMTPHGGSNSTSFGASSFFNGLDEFSEAVRDLRYSYFTGDEGAYLFGGVESNNSITNAFVDFNNIDVNCNGFTGNTIIGLNNDAYPGSSFLSYSSVIGTGSILGGDGIVDDFRANINNYLTGIQADTFILMTPDDYGFGDLLHTEALSDNRFNSIFTFALDEPDNFNLAYVVEAGQRYFGKSDKKSCLNPNCLYEPDTDYYRFNVDENSFFSINLANIPSTYCFIEILDDNNTSVFYESSLGTSNLTGSIYLTSGEYFIKIVTKWDQNNTNYPYTFKFDLENADAEIKPVANSCPFLYIYPDPATNSINIESSINQPYNVVIINNIGQKVLFLENHKNNQGIDITSLPQGSYIIQLLDKNLVLVNSKFIKL